MNKLGWFVTGTGLGALGGLLYAPKAGHETRGELLSAATEKGATLTKQVVAKSGDYVQQGKQVAGQYLAQGKSLASDHLGRANAALKAGKQAYAEGSSQEQLGEAALEIGSPAIEPGA